jgi:DNA-directed RNA polymerase I, II, and III subunit RPABC5
MIIPIRCFTCGTVIADKWNPFIKLVMEKKNESTEKVDYELDIKYIEITDDGSIKKSPEGEALDELKMHKYCCRRMFLGNVHLISYI